MYPGTPLAGQPGAGATCGAARAACMPLPAVFLLQGVQALVLLGLLSLLGLRMGHRVGLGSPLLQAWLGHDQAPSMRELKPLHAVAVGVTFLVGVLRDLLTDLGCRQALAQEVSRAACG